MILLLDFYGYRILFSKTNQNNTNSLVILLTGGAGFIGSAVVRQLINTTPHQVVNVDKLTYAANLASLNEIDKSDRYHLVQADICDVAAIKQVFLEFRPDIVMHLAAESHVDRSIDSSAAFIQTNIIGTYSLLEVARQYWSELTAPAKSRFRFHHISTDEVYGDLAARDHAFSENHPYAPSSPYSASKASADHLVKAWYRTYGLPIILTNSSNNYGPFQFPEKLIPRMICDAVAGKSLPIYGDGLQIRDWLFVEDHAEALILVALQAEIGKTYNIGSNCELTNLEVVTQICDTLQLLAPKLPAGIKHYRDLIRFVTDRLGHDRRYAIDASKIKRELDWSAKMDFAQGIQHTLNWYLQNLDCIEANKKS